MQGIKIKGYLERTSLLKDLVVHYGHDDQMRLCHEKMAEADKLPQNRDLIMNSIMYEYLFLLARKFPGSQLTSYEKKSDHAEEALKYIEDHYCDSITIQDIADHLKINRSYLHRVFKSFTGGLHSELSFRLQNTSGMYFVKKYGFIHPRSCTFRKFYRSSLLFQDFSSENGDKPQ